MKKFILPTIIFLTAILFNEGNAQIRQPKTYTYQKDYIITKKDTIYCIIDKSSLTSPVIKYSFQKSKGKVQKVKSSNVIELKCRFIYKNINVDGSPLFLKVLTENMVSLYSSEKQGKTNISDKESDSFTRSDQVPARSTFYIKKNEIVIRLDRSNYQLVLKGIFEGDDAILNRIDDVKYDDLEFELLNMVIRYNYRLKTVEEQPN